MKASRFVLLTVGALVGTATGCAEPINLPDPVGIPPSPASPAPVLRRAWYIHLAGAAGVGDQRLARGDRIAWSPDSRKIAFVRDGSLHVMNAHGTGQKQLTTSVMIQGAPRWSPDGSRIAFTGLKAGGGEIFVISADGSNETQLTYEKSVRRLAGWSPDGSKIAFVGGPDTDLNVIGADGKNRSRLIQLGSGVSGADWSPDGRRIALGSAGSVYVVNADGSDPTRLTDNDAERLVVYRAVWSPRGDRIAFSLRPPACDCEGGFEGDTSSFVVQAISADGTNRISIARRAENPSWLPDGRTISFDGWRSSGEPYPYGDPNRGAWIVPADGGQPTSIVPDSHEALWSPDGKKVAYLKMLWIWD